MPDATFDLDRLAVENGKLVVRGRWSGVRGMRFVRPTLVVDGRPVLASLDHKPWPADGDPWTAAFPWDDGDVGDRDVALAVAPSVTVQLRGGADGGTAAGAPAAGAPASGRAPGQPGSDDPPPHEGGHLAVLRAVLDERDRLRERLAGLADGGDAARERDALRAELAELRAAADAREAALAARAEELETALRRAGARVHELEREHTPDAEAARIGPVERRRDRALEQLAEAVRDRDAAVRTRDRMERRRDEALAATREAQERVRIVGEQRDALALAHESLRRQVEALRVGDGTPAVPGAAASDGAAASEPEPAAVAAAASARDPDDTGPIGVREIPDTRTVAPDLHRQTREHEREHRPRAFDLWAIRVLGGVAALCFLTLLVLLLRVFVGAS